MVINKPMRFSEVLARDYQITTAATDGFFRNEFLRTEIGSADLKEQLKKYLPGWGWQKSVDGFLQYWFESEHFVDERLVKSIGELRKRELKCYLATNQEKYRAQYMRREMGLEQVFDRIFVSCEVRYLKPSAEFWSVCWSSIGSPDKHEILVWDDKEKAVKGARDFGFHAEQYTNYDKYEIVLSNYLREE